MPQGHLDKQILTKLSEKIRKSVKYTREQISKRAAKQGISSEAAQILWAKENGISATRFQRSLPPHVQEQVRGALPAIITKQVIVSPTRSHVKTTKQRVTTSFKPMIDYVIANKELRERCGDLIKAKSKFDRAIREATTVLDDRLKTLGNITIKMNPSDLVGKVLNPDPKKALLVASSDADEQEGIFSLCKGLFLAFRNPAHHRLSDRFTREDALKFCGFVDLILYILDRAKKSPAP